MWVPVELQDAPPMETVILTDGKKVFCGWNESTQPEEDAAYCMWEDWLDVGDVTHWMKLPELPGKW